jgi:cytochrome c biogenesis protein CcdA
VRKKGCPVVNTSIFFGGSVLAAVVAGAIALFAPCCISAMLPAYFATSFQNRRRLVAMSFVFAGGTATVILPIALGATVVRRLIFGGHRVVYVLGGALMIGLGAYVFLGGKIHLPMHGRRAGTRRGPAAVYSLGLFSGVASSCCAPVLAGLIALSGVASSFVLPLGLGAAYVFGMVAPLFVISLLWDRYNWRSSQLFRPRSVTWGIGSLRRSIGGTDVASALLLWVMGAASVWVGLAGNSMPGSSGWQATATVALQHLGKTITAALSWIPNWAAATGLLIVVVLLARVAGKQVRRAEADVRATQPAVEWKEEILEHEGT